MICHSPWQYAIAIKFVYVFHTIVAKEMVEYSDCASHKHHGNVFSFVRAIEFWGEINKWQFEKKTSSDFFPKWCFTVLYWDQCITLLKRLILCKFSGFWKLTWTLPTSSYTSIMIKQCLWAYIIWRRVLMLDTSCSHYHLHPPLSYYSNHFAKQEIN